jgi:PucR-like helix-turn-helix protein
MNDAMQVSANTQPGYAAMQLTGRLSLRSVETVRGALVGLLNDVGCVVADLSGLALSQPALLSVFPAALAEAGGWPRARLGLFGADAELLGHLRSQGVCDAVAVADELDVVLAATNQWPHQAWAPPHRDADASPPARDPDGEALDDRASMRRVLTGAENAAELALFVRERLGCLIDYDRAGGFELVTTLSVYLDCGGDYEMAACELGIHRSTLRYRLYRICEVSGQDLGDASTRFDLHAATSEWRSNHGPF